MTYAFLTNLCVLIINAPMYLLCSASTICKRVVLAGAFEQNNRLVKIRLEAIGHLNCLCRYSCSRLEPNQNAPSFHALMNSPNHPERIAPPHHPDQSLSEYLPRLSHAEDQGDDLHRDFAERLDKVTVEGGYYAGEFIAQPKSFLTTAEKLRLLESHPVFNGE
jgi:hypothetical protein